MSCIWTSTVVCNQHWREAATLLSVQLCIRCNTIWSVSVLRVHASFKMNNQHHTK